MTPEITKTLSLIETCEIEAAKALARFNFKDYEWFTVKAAALTLRLNSFVR